ncbi:BLUF domain-containing protein, partial [Candidatus Saccharibacteria bacterium]|nr:BLUF domain-containing protein [Candidatus Saccharibacteria bacterium]
MLYTKCYISNSVDLWNKNQLDTLFLFAKTQNVFQNITGLLLYNEGTFLQVLEGEKDMVDSLLSKIKLDKRHNQLTVMMDRSIKHRLFKNFQTGLVSSNNEKELVKLKSKIQLPKTSKYAKSLGAILDSFTRSWHSLSG